MIFKKAADRSSRSLIMELNSEYSRLHAGAGSAHFPMAFEPPTGFKEVPAPQSRWRPELIGLRPGVVLLSFKPFAVLFSITPIWTQ
jgi:hypothetical protein